jgi:hypothetical protein
MRLKDVVVVAAVLGAIAWYSTKNETPQPKVLPVPVERDTANFRCEGKTHCSQMISCEEATFYLRSCPGTQMDGDNDGIPCESQHCGH